MHVVAIPDHRTDFLFAQSTLPYLYLSQTHKVLRHEMYMVYTEGLEPVAFAVTFSLGNSADLNDVLFGNDMKNKGSVLDKFLSILIEGRKCFKDHISQLPLGKEWKGEVARRVIINTVQVSPTI